MSALLRPSVPTLSLALESILGPRKPCRLIRFRLRSGKTSGDLPARYCRMDQRRHLAANYSAPNPATPWRWQEKTLHGQPAGDGYSPVSYTHLRAHETPEHLV